MKYIVKTIAMSVKNNRIAEHGEFVDESELNTNASELIKDGAIRVLTEEENEALFSKEDNSYFDESEEAEAEEEEESNVNVHNLDVKSEEVVENTEKVLSAKDKVKADLAKK